MLWQTSRRGLSFIYLLLIGLFLLKGVSTQTVQKTGFDKTPNKFFYFKDSQVERQRMILVRYTRAYFFFLFSSGRALARCISTYFISFRESRQAMGKSQWYWLRWSQLLVWTSFWQRQGKKERISYKNAWHKKKLTAKCRLIFWVKAKDIGKRLIRENHGRNFLHP